MINLSRRFLRSDSVIFPPNCPVWAIWHSMASTCVKKKAIKMSIQGSIGQLDLYWGLACCPFSGLVSLIVLSLALASWSKTWQSNLIKQVPLEFDRGSPQVTQNGWKDHNIYHNDCQYWPYITWLNMPFFIFSICSIFSCCCFCLSPPPPFTSQTFKTVPLREATQTKSLSIKGWLLHCKYCKGWTKFRFW